MSTGLPALNSPSSGILACESARDGNPEKSPIRETGLELKRVSTGSHPRLKRRLQVLSAVASETVGAPHAAGSSECGGSVRGRRPEEASPC